MITIFPEENSWNELKATKMKRLFIILPIILGLVSCDNETSLQEYYVEHQNNNQFLAFDVPASLLTGENTALNPEQLATIETIKKVNILALRKNEKTEAIFEEEQERLSEILKNDDYQQLFRYGGHDRRAELYYRGEEDAIDELIIFGSDMEKGFGIARVTGDDMDPEAMIRLFKSFKDGELDLQGLPDLDGFKD